MVTMMTSIICLALTAFSFPVSGCTARPHQDGPALGQGHERPRGGNPTGKHDVSITCTGRDGRDGTAAHGKPGDSATSGRGGDGTAGQGGRGANASSTIINGRSVTRDARCTIDDNAPGKR